MLQFLAKSFYLIVVKCCLTVSQMSINHWINLHATSLTTLQWLHPRNIFKGFPLEYRVSFEWNAIVTGYNDSMCTLFQKISPVWACGLHGIVTQWYSFRHSAIKIPFFLTSCLPHSLFQYFHIYCIVHLVLLKEVPRVSARKK